MSQYAYGSQPTLSQLQNGNQLVTYNSFEHMQQVAFMPTELVSVEATAARLGRYFQRARIVGDVAMGGLSTPDHLTELYLVDLGPTRDNTLALVNKGYNPQRHSASDYVSYLSLGMGTQVGREGDNSERFNDKLGDYVSLKHIAIGNTMLNDTHIITVAGLKTTNGTKLRYAQRPTRRSQR